MANLLVQLTWLISAAIIVCIYVRIGVTGQAEDSHKILGSSTMTWVSASNATALCNDYSQAGFFIHQNQSSRDWVVFLESGGLCYNTESCNRRFFVRKVSFYYKATQSPISVSGPPARMLLTISKFSASSNYSLYTACVNDTQN